MISSEIWRRITKFEGTRCYWEVSSEGRVRSVRKADGRKTILKASMNHKGYLRVCVRKAQGYRAESVHRLVAEAFLGPCPEGLQVNHIDENKTNNRVDNLEYVTCAQNNNHGDRTAKAALALGRPVAQINAHTGERLRIFQSLSEAESQTGIAHQNISKCCCEKRKTAGGFRWAFVEAEG